MQIQQRQLAKLLNSCGIKGVKDERARGQSGYRCLEKTISPVRKISAENATYFPEFTTVVEAEKAFDGKWNFRTVDCTFCNLDYDNYQLLLHQHYELTVAQCTFITLSKNFTESL